MAVRKKELSEFGACLIEEIKKAGMTKTDFYTTAKINKPYFYEILTGTPPSQDFLEKMLNLLDEHLPPDPARRNLIINAAAKCRNEIPYDINELIKSNPDKWDYIRAHLPELLSL